MGFILPSECRVVKIRGKSGRKGRKPFLKTLQESDCFLRSGEYQFDVGVGTGPDQGNSCHPVFAIDGLTRALVL